MSSIILSGDTSGAITLAAPAVSGTNTITLPAATGTVMVSGNMPAFSAYRLTDQSISNSTFVKVQLNTEEFDTANAFDSSTNYRFTPLVAGYYQLNAAVSLSGTAISVALGSIYKNGTEYKRGTQIPTVSASTVEVVISSLVYFNGTTDYAEIYAFSTATSGNVVTGGASVSYFNGVMVRGA